ncbi:MAG: DNA adenine methylase [Anaerolineae bacterium]|nr:DNA adenine methylase [Anaerolineae bacterium]
MAAQILTFFPDDATRLLEPFAGSAAVALAGLHHKKVASVVLNDANSALMALWAAIIDHPDEIAAQYRALWIQQQGQERAFYDTIRAEFNRTHHPDHFLYLLARCVKASVRYNAQGEFNQSPDNRRKGAQPDTMRDQIAHASRLLINRTSLHNLDYRDVLDMAVQSDIVYLDPPYQGVSKSRDPRYQASITFEGFARTLHTLNERGISYIVSYDGRTDAKIYGARLPAELDLAHIELEAGRSSQATLLGRRAHTFESLYLSPALMSRLGKDMHVAPHTLPRQLQLFESP